MFHIFLIAVQMLSGRAMVLAIVRVVTLLGSQIVPVEVALPLQEGPGHAVARPRLKIVLRPVVQAGVFPLHVAVLLAVRLPLVLHAPVLEPHFHLLLR